MSSIIQWLPSAFMKELTQPWNLESSPSRQWAFASACVGKLWLHSSCAVPLAFVCDPHTKLQGLCGDPCNGRGFVQVSVLLALVIEGNIDIRHPHEPPACIPGRSHHHKADRYRQFRRLRGAQEHHKNTTLKEHP